MPSAASDGDHTVIVTARDALNVATVDASTSRSRSTTRRPPSGSSRTRRATTTVRTRPPRAAAPIEGLYYDYPTNLVFLPGSFDITKVEIFADGDWIVFRAHIEDLVNHQDPVAADWGAPQPSEQTCDNPNRTDMNLQKIDIYIDAHGGRGLDERLPEPLRRRRHRGRVGLRHLGRRVGASGSSCRTARTRRELGALQERQRHLALQQLRWRTTSTSASTGRSSGLILTTRRQRCHPGRGTSSSRLLARRRHERPEPRRHPLGQRQHERVADRRRRGQRGRPRPRRQHHGRRDVAGRGPRAGPARRRRCSTTRPPRRGSGSPTIRSRACSRRASRSTRRRRSFTPFVRRPRARAHSVGSARRRAGRVLDDHHRCHGRRRRQVALAPGGPAGARATR